MTIGSVLSLPFIISGLICAGDQPDVTAKLLSVTLFMCGVSTVIQCVFGVRYAGLSLFTCVRFHNVIHKTYKQHRQLPVNLYINMT